jgi:hypothetical protein
LNLTALPLFATGGGEHHWLAEVIIFWGIMLQHQAIIFLFIKGISSFCLNYMDVSFTPC